MAAAINITTLKITPELLGLIAELDEFKGAWRALGRLAPDRLSSLRRVATIESIGSSTRIEGAKLSDREVERLLSETNCGRVEHGIWAHRVSAGSRAARLVVAGTHGLRPR